MSRCGGWVFFLCAITLESSTTWKAGRLIVHLGSTLMLILTASSLLCQVFIDLSLTSASLLLAAFYDHMCDRDKNKRVTM